MHSEEDAGGRLGRSSSGKSQDARASVSFAGPDPHEFAGNRAEHVDLDGVYTSTLMMSDPLGRCHLGISDENRLRSAWNVWVLILLMYTGVVFPFTLAFVDFGIPAREFPNWYWWFEFLTLDMGFYIDLIANFFFSYRDDHGREVFDLYRIAAHYLRTYFVVNLVACFPPEAFSWGVCAVAGMASCTTSSVNQVGRLSRLQRVSRLSRLVRLSRLFKISGILARSQIVKEMRSFRGVRIINQCFGLLFVVHLVACGWWIVASLHTDVEETWIGRRQSGSSGLSILELSEEGKLGRGFQWLTAMYFALTIFTTVGFGDMSAYTSWEMVYVCTAMIAGCIVNGIILSEVISIYTSDNEEVRQLEELRGLVRSFGKHMQVEAKMREQMAQALNSSKVDSTAYNRDEMRMVLTSGMLPRRLLSALPETLFSGKLVLNKFVCGPSLFGVTMPPRFPILFGLACSSFYFDSLQTIYHVHDHAWNVYLVLNGTFSYVARTAHLPSVAAPSLLTGLSQIQTGAEEGPDEGVSPYQLFSWQQYFGDLEIVMEACPRLATARCESQEGHVLVLHKRELFALVEEFPDLSKCWHTVATHRARRRVIAQKGFQRGTYKELAVRNLQRGLKYLLRRRTGSRALGRFSNSVAAVAPPVIRRPSEIVPEYALYLQAHMDEVQAGMCEMRDSLSTLTTGMDDLKASFYEIEKLASGIVARSLVSKRVMEEL